jgi:hypothetical protein
MREKYRIAGSKGWKEVKFEPGDLVWLHLRKEQVPDLRKNKLMSHVDGPFKILEKICQCFLHRQDIGWSRSRVPILRWSCEL